MLMCGITGYIDWEEQEPEQVLREMSVTLACRGPDDHGEVRSGPIALAHRRLIVIDPEGGTQPMVQSVGGNRYMITYNGELYNMNELKNALLARGHTLLSRSDTELLLLSYIEWGRDCLQKLNGIFAFAIWDESRQRLFMARDRLGVKPLFYSRQNGFFAFASELKALLAHPKVTAIVDTEGLAELLFIGPARTPGRAVFKHIVDLKPGHFLEYTKDHMVEAPFWQLQSHPHEDDVETTAKTVQELLYDAVSRQLVSDVPIATLLSGGLDSSAVSAFAAEALSKQGETLHTYAIDFVDMEKHFVANAFQTGRDAPWAKRVADHIGSVHHPVILDTRQMTDHLLRPLYARDLPGMADIDASLFLFSQEIKKNATVALSGEAADEVFGGYPWFHREEALTADTFPWSLQLHERTGWIRPELLETMTPDTFVKERYLAALDEVPILLGESQEEARIRDISYLSITRFLPTLLERKDRMSMAAGLEVRVPFCDHRLVEYVWNIPWHMKMDGNQSKGILRRALKGWLPEDVINRKKSPYPSTPDPVYLNTVRAQFEDVIHEPSSPLLDLINVPWLEELVKRSKETTEHRPWFGQIMAIPQMFDYLVQVNEWLRTYRIQLIP